MTVNLLKFTSKMIGDKRRWRQYKARIKQLPTTYRRAVDEVERYLMHFVPIDEDHFLNMLEDLGDLFEQAAADGTPIRAVVGENPVEFVDTFVQNYSEGGYVPKQAKKRLTDALVQDEEEAGRSGS